MHGLKTEIQRWKFLLNKTTVGFDTETGEPENFHFSFKGRWSIWGIHSHNWWWVTRYGTRDCGCVYNPLTRKRVLVRWRCDQHGDAKRRITHDENGDDMTAT